MRCARGAREAGEGTIARTSKKQPPWRPPTLRAPVTRDEAVSRLDALARRGKLPGFTPAEDGFSVALFGEPFDRRLEAHIEGGIEGKSNPVEIRFTPKLLMKAPVAFVAGTLVALWPGTPMLDAMIPADWGWWPTWTWYLPLVIVPTVAALPPLWRKSERGATDHAREQVERIATALNAERVGAD